MAGFKNGALALKKKDIGINADPNFINILVDTSNNLYTIDEFGVYRSIAGYDIVSSGSDISVVTSGGTKILSLNSTSVVSGTYGTSTSVPQIVVDNKGRILSAYNIPISASGLGTVTSISISSSTLKVINSPITTFGTFGVNLSATGVVSGSILRPFVDSYGRVLSGGLISAADISDRSTDVSMSANSDDKIPTEKAIKTYTDTKFSSLSALQEPTGFIDKNQTMTFSDSTRVFTISANSGFNVYYRGIIYNKISDSITISTLSGAHYIYYTSAGILTESTTPWDIATSVQVALIYWTGTYSFGICEERHGTVMDWATHKYNHKNYGTKYTEGFVPTYTLNSDSFAYIGISNGVISDEDIEISIIQGTSGNYFSQQINYPATIPVYYRSGTNANGSWKKDSATTFPYKNSGGTGVNFNALVTGNWTQTQVSNTNYCAYFIYATDIIREPIISIQGQRQDTSLANAINNNIPTSLQFSDFPVAEAKLLFRIILETKTSYSGNIYRSRIAEITDYRNTSVNLITQGSTGTVTYVGISANPILSISGSPITNAGTFDIDFSPEPVNTFFAGPVSGTSATPTFRTIQYQDLPITYFSNNFLPLSGGTMSGNLESLGIYPFDSFTYDLGSTSKRWNKVWTKDIQTNTFYTSSNQINVNPSNTLTFIGSLDTTPLIRLGENLSTSVGSGDISYNSGRIKVGDGSVQRSIAYTSDFSSLGNYLPLSGGTLTGQLKGTSISASGNISANVASMGSWSSNSNFARFGHVNFNTPGGFGFLQTDSGALFTDGPIGQGLDIRVNGISKFSVDNNGATLYGKLVGSNSSQTVWSKDVVPTTAVGNVNYINTPIVVQRLAGVGDYSNVAGIGFHNIGVNGSMLYYDPTSNNFMHNNNYGGIYTLWDSRNFTPGNYATTASLSAYLLKTGGTLTGNLLGTGAAFNSVFSTSGFIKGGGTSTEFLKADGSVDSNSYATTASVASINRPTTEIVYGAGSGITSSPKFITSFSSQWNGVQINSPNNTYAAYISFATNSNTSASWGLEKRDAQDFGTTLGCFAIEDSLAGSDNRRFPLVIDAGVSGPIKLSRNVLGRESAQTVWSKDISPIASSNTNYVNAPIVTQRITGVDYTNVAGIGFHNVGINASMLYYDPASSNFMHNNHSGGIYTLWDSRNLVPEKIATYGKFIDHGTIGQYTYVGFLPNNGAATRESLSVKLYGGHWGDVGGCEVVFNAYGTPKAAYKQRMNNNSVNWYAYLNGSNFEFYVIVGEDAGWGSFGVESVFYSTAGRTSISNYFQTGSPTGTLTTISWSNYNSGDIRWNSLTNNITSYGSYYVSNYSGGGSPAIITNQGNATLWTLGLDYVGTGAGALRFSNFANFGASYGVGTYFESGGSYNALELRGIGDTSSGGLFFGYGGTTYIGKKAGVLEIGSDLNIYINSPRTVYVNSGMIVTGDLRTNNYNAAAGCYLGRYSSTQRLQLATGSSLTVLDNIDSGFRVILSPDVYRDLVPFYIDTNGIVSYHSLRMYPKIVTSTYTSNDTNAHTNIMTGDSLMVLSAGSSTLTMDDATDNGKFVYVYNNSGSDKTITSTMTYGLEIESGTFVETSFTIHHHELWVGIKLDSGYLRGGWKFRKLGA